MDSKTVLWVVIAIVAYWILKGSSASAGGYVSGGVGGSFYAGGVRPVPGPSVTGTSYAQVPPATNQWDTITSVATALVNKIPDVVNGLNSDENGYEITNYSYDGSSAS